MVCRAEIKRQKELKRAARGVRLERREARERLKSRRDYEREAQAAFNAWVRERDRFEGCISCPLGEDYQGRGIWGRQWHAGHYRSTGAAPQLRFHEDNVHKQCAACNSHKSGNAVEYRIRLIRKIGVERVEWLENHNSVAKRDTDELKLIRKEYQLKLKVLKAQRENAGSFA